METETVAPAGLRLLSVCRVEPAAAPPRNVKAKLSFLDAPWVATPPIQEVFLYAKGGGAAYGGIVKRLKESLAASLALYLPYAGKLAYVPETRDVVVDCSDDPGVDFIEAEAMAGCVMNFSRLASDDVPSMELGRLLVPKHDVRVLPAPVLIVQVTRLNPGLAIGVSVHHAPADGRAFDLFMNAWSSMSRGGAGASPPVTRFISPPINYSREAIAHPNSDKLAHEVLSKVAPNLPHLANATMEEEDDYMSQHCYRLRHRSFLLGANDIRTLKQHIHGLDNKDKKPVSMFVALAALSWVAFVRAKGLAAGEDTYLVFQVDLRARLRPPVDAGYIGNCVRACMASADAGELVGDMGLLRASRAIQAAVKEAVEAPLDKIGEWMERLIALPAARLANVGGSPQFRVYQTADFGFGMPHKVVPLSMPGSPETSSGHVSMMNDDHGGRIVLSAGKRDGEVRLSVSLDPVLMDAFKKSINNDIPIRGSRL